MYMRLMHSTSEKRLKNHGSSGQEVVEEIYQSEEMTELPNSSGVRELGHSCHTGWKSTNAPGIQRVAKELELIMSKLALLQPA